MCVCSYTSNWVTRAFGVWPSTPVGYGCFLAGASMVVGFVTAQAVQNFMLPENTSWADQSKQARPISAAATAATAASACARLVTDGAAAGGAPRATG